MILAPLTDRQLAKLGPQERAAYDAQQKHHKLWGHLPPQRQQALRGVESLSERAVEVHARELKTDPVHFAAAAAYHRWPVGQEMSVEEYEAAVAQVLSERHGY